MKDLILKVKCQARDCDVRKNSCLLFVVQVSNDESIMGMEANSLRRNVIQAENEGNR